MKAAILGLALTLGACSSSSPETAGPSSAPFVTGSPYASCYLVEEQQFAPSSGTCWRVQASASNILAHCYPANGAAPTNELVTSGQLDRFDVLPGGCFEFYQCGTTSAVPTVTMCP